MYMVSLYFWAQIIKDTSIVDIGWGIGFVLIAWTLWFAQDEPSSNYSLIMLAVTLWGLRLGWHIFSRHRGRGEDWRYANWRKEWGKNHWWRSFLQVFILQGLMMLIVGSSVIVATDGDSHNGALFVVGSIIWSFGFLFETIGDWQLNKFLSQRKDKKQIMQSGLWRYTRHPNYFGEITLWWGIWLMSIATNPLWWTIVSPLMISYLLLWVSGIPMLEKKYDDNKQFQAYKQQTNALIPCFPKK